MKINVERVFWGVGIILLIIGLIGLYRGIKIRIDGPKIKGVVKEAFKEVIEEAPLEEIISKGVEKGSKRIVSSLNVLQKDVQGIRKDVGSIRKEIQMMKGGVKGEKEVIVIPGPRKEKVTKKISKETMPVPVMPAEETETQKVTEDHTIKIHFEGQTDYVEVKIDDENPFTLKMGEQRDVVLTKETHEAAISFFKNGEKFDEQDRDLNIQKEQEGMKFIALE